MYVVLWGRIHEVKVHEVVDIQRFEQEDCVAQIGALNFRDGGIEHLIPE